MPPTEKNAIFVLYLKLLNFTIMTSMVAKTKQVFRHIECVRKFRNFENRLFINTHRSEDIRIYTSIFEEHFTIQQTEEIKKEIFLSPGHDQVVTKDMIGLYRNMIRLLRT